MIENVVIVAAGQGTRLRPLTDTVPKAMVALHGRALLDWNVLAAREAGARRIAVVCGYKRETIVRRDVELRFNPSYATTNMLHTLMCAEDVFGDGFILVYGDCVYEPGLIAMLLRTRNDLALVVDTEWEPYWRARSGNPLADAETLKLDGDSVIEIGQRPQSLSDIQGQFCGLVAFAGAGVARLEELRDEASRSEAAGGLLSGSPRSWDAMYTTDALQALIARGFLPHAHRVGGRWLEIDNLEDYEIAKRCASPVGDTLRIDRSVLLR